MKITIRIIYILLYYMPGVRTHLMDCPLGIGPCCALIGMELLRVFVCKVIRTSVVLRTNPTMYHNDNCS